MLNEVSCWQDLYEGCVYCGLIGGTVGRMLYMSDVIL